MLLQWARFYRQIYDLPPSDKPDDGTIEDDTALDKWFEQFQRDIARKSGGKGDPKYDLNKVVAGWDGSKNGTPAAPQAIPVSQPQGIIMNR